jgi:hypothetical protein
MLLVLLSLTFFFVRSKKEGRKEGRNIMAAYTLFFLVYAMSRHGAHSLLAHLYSCNLCFLTR